jgi:hypothetical protein
MPTKSNVTIYDKQGRDYQIDVSDDESTLLLTVYRSLDWLGLTHMVGNANCVFKSDNVMLLGDIHFVDKIDRNLFGWIYAFFYREPKSFQGLGLGTATLKFIVKYAKEKGVKKIHGLIVPKDLDANPNLPKWYKQHGFIVNTQTSEGIKINLQIL